MRGVQQAVDGVGAARRSVTEPKPCAGTGPGSLQYDACHAAEFEVILQLRAEIETLRAQRARAVEALRNARGHTSHLPAADRDLLVGLLASIERILDAALRETEAV